MSSIDPTPSSYARIASSRYGTSSRFTMNPVLSDVRTGTLPSFFAKSKAASYTAGEVAIVFTTSTSFISGTGLKKCSPINLSGRRTAVKSSVIEIEEVFEAKIASFFTTSSSDAYIFFFSSTFSMMASMTMSQSARSSFFVVPFNRARISSFCCGVIPPFSTGRSANFASDFSIPAKPLSRYFCSTSSTVTSNPAVADTCAMPEPIRPQPSTPTFLISIRTVSLSAGKQYSPHSGAALLCVLCVLCGQELSTAEDAKGIPERTLRKSWLCYSGRRDGRSQADDPAHALGDRRIQRHVGAVDDLGDDIRGIELLTHDRFRQPGAEGKNLVGKFHFGKQFAQLLHRHQGLFFLCLSENQRDRGHLVAKGKIVLADVGRKELADFLHSGFDGFFSVLLRH